MELPDEALAQIEDRLNRAIFGSYYDPDVPGSMAVQHEMPSAFWVDWEIENLLPPNELTFDSVVAMTSPHDWPEHFWIPGDDSMDEKIEWLTHALKDMALLVREVRRLRG